MDERRFDEMARLLGATGSRRMGLRAALSGLLGAAVAAGGGEPSAAARRRNGKGTEKDGASGAGRRRRRRGCKPKCGPGYECVKEGKERICRCPSGVECAGTCCAAGKECRDGACADPEPTPACVAFGEACKDVGRRCCDGLVCGSGSDSDPAITCRRDRGAACAASEECAYGLGCRDGRCEGPPPVEGLAVPCDAAAQQQCTSPGATCSTYTTPGAPSGAFCTLPVGAVCEGDPECSCFRCWYPAAQRSGRNGRAAEKTCCQPAGQPCGSAADCCLGLPCSGGVCGGSGGGGGEICPAKRVCVNNTTCCPSGQVCDHGDACCPESRAEGATCVVNGDCCSGVCSAGNCAGTCPADRICIDNSGCCETGSRCSDDECCPADKKVAAETCSANSQCCSGACNCSSSGFPTVGSRCQSTSYAYDFDGVERAKWGWRLWDSENYQWDAFVEEAQASPAGTSYGLVPQVIMNGSDYPRTNYPNIGYEQAQTILGGYVSLFPEDGYVVSLDIYIERSAASNGEKFSYSSAIQTTAPTCAHKRDFIFRGGKDKNTGAYCILTGTGENSDPIVCEGDLLSITEDGWYTFQHRFYRTEQQYLACDLTVAKGIEELKTWTISDTEDKLGAGGVTNVGGNRYGIFVVNTIGYAQRSAESVEADWIKLPIASSRRYSL